MTIFGDLRPNCEGSQKMNWFDLVEHILKSQKVELSFKHKLKWIENKKFNNPIALTIEKYFWKVLWQYYKNEPCDGSTLTFKDIRPALSSTPTNFLANFHPPPHTHTHPCGVKTMHVDQGLWKYIYFILSNWFIGLWN